MRKGVLMTCAALLVATSTHSYAQSTTSSVPYITPNRGGFTVQTLGGTDPLIVGYGRVQVASSTSPAGFAAIEFTQNGVLVSEAAEAAAAPIQSGRVFAEVGGAVNTAVAFVNPTPSPVVVSFRFT